MSVQTTYGTTMTKAIEGALADAGPHVVEPFYNGEASANIPFGRAVKQGTEDNEAVLPAAESDEIIGIVIHADDYTTGSDGELTSTGLIPGARLGVLRKGVIWAMARTAVAKGNRCWVRAVSSDTGFEVLGGLEDSDDSTDMIDCTKQAVWRDSAAQGELARLEVDFTNKP